MLALELHQVGNGIGFSDDDTKKLFTPTEIEKALPSKYAREGFVELIKLAGFLSKSRLEDERELSISKWFDYRFCSPVSATLSFYKIYQDIYRAIWRSNFDIEKANLKRGIPVDGFWADGREFNSVWGARQAADRLGLPYDFFIREAMEAALRRGARRPPRPNQLYDDRNVKVIRELWEGRRLSLPLVSALPQYRVELFRGLPAQVEHQTWVVDNLKARVASHHAIAQACFAQRVVPIERIEDEFSPYQMEQVRYEAASITAEPIEPLPASAFWPSCFGIPHARSESSPICAGCHARATCKLVEAKVREKIVGRYGSDTPRDEERRAQGRARTARHRARKAAASNRPAPL